MTGADLRQGRYDSRALEKDMNSFKAFFGLYCRFRKIWNEQIAYIQSISRREREDMRLLSASGSRIVTGEHGKRLEANLSFLTELADLGYIEKLKISQKDLSFDFSSEETRFRLRDIGCFLECYVYWACKTSRQFGDVQCSAVIEWSDAPKSEQVVNEIDVMCVRGVRPLLISCKATEVHTEAINELAVLRDRFGSQIAAAALVTTCTCRQITRRRAAELGISVIDRYSLSAPKLISRLSALFQ